MRRRAIEAERQAKLMELQEKRKEQDAKLEQKRQEKEKAREEAARERERKLEARNAAIQSSVVELEKKILLKVHVHKGIVCSALKLKCRF